MTTRIVVTLSSNERAGLAELAERELRHPRDQLRAILRKELKQQGLLEPSPVLRNLAQDQETP